jgi:hypothetical protein
MTTFRSASQNFWNWQGILRNNQSLVTVLLFSGGAAWLDGQSTPLARAHEELPLPEIIERMSSTEAAQAQELKHYTSTRTYHLDNRRFNRTAEMAIRLTYRYPGRKDFEVLSESGPGPLRDRVLRRMVESEVEASGDELRRLNQLTPANYEFRLLRLDRDEGRPVFVLDAIPKTKSNYLIKGEVWVDAEDFGVSRVVGRPVKNPSFWIRGPRLVYRYAKFGSFWLPVSTDSQAEALLFGHTEVKIRYHDYRINSEHQIGFFAK